MDKYLKAEQNYLKNNPKNTMFTASITWIRGKNLLMFGNMDSDDLQSVQSKSGPLLLLGQQNKTDWKFLDKGTKLGACLPCNECILILTKWSVSRVYTEPQERVIDSNLELTSRSLGFFACTIAPPSEILTIFSIQGTWMSSLPPPSPHLLQPSGHESLWRRWHPH